MNDETRSKPPSEGSPPPPLPPRRKLINYAVIGIAVLSLFLTAQLLYESPRERLSRIDYCLDKMKKWNIGKTYGGEWSLLGLGGVPWLKASTAAEVLFDHCPELKKH